MSVLNKIRYLLINKLFTKEEKKVINRSICYRAFNIETKLMKEKDADIENLKKERSIQDKVVKVFW